MCYVSFYRYIFVQFLGSFVKLWKATVSFVMSVRLYGTTRLPNYELSWNWTFEYFSKIYHKNSSCIKIGHASPVLYMKTNIHLWSHLVQSFLEWVMFQKKFVENIKTHILGPIMWDNVDKYCRAGQATDGNIIRRMCIACWVPKATKTHSEYVIFIAFPLQYWLHESDFLLCYTCTVCLVAFQDERKCYTTHYNINSHNSKRRFMYRQHL
jgi:hypothetical protein